MQRPELLMIRIGDSDVQQSAQAPARSLLREERYDPYTGVTITVWSNAAGAAIPAEQRLN